MHSLKPLIYLYLYLTSYLGEQQKVIFLQLFLK